MWPVSQYGLLSRDDVKVRCWVQFEKMLFSADSYDEFDSIQWQCTFREDVPSFEFQISLFTFSSRWPSNAMQHRILCVTQFEPVQETIAQRFVNVHTFKSLHLICKVRRERGNVNGDVFEEQV